MADLIASRQASAAEKLSDLTSRADYLARHSSTPPMTWYEFEKTQKVEAPRNWLSIPTLVGAMLGGIVCGLFLGAPLLVTAGGALAGGAIGQMIPDPYDKRDAQVMAYEEYLNKFEKRLSAQNQLQQPSVSTAPPNVPGKAEVCRSV